MRSKLARMFVVLLVLGLVAAACSSKNTASQPTSPGETSTEGTPTESTGGTMTIGSDAANDHGTGTVSGDSIEVELDNFYFEPTVIVGTPGAQVKLELKNDSQTLHNFTLQDQTIDEDVLAGEDDNVTVTFPASGFLEFFCKYHKASGMVGELTV